MDPWSISISLSSRYNAHRSRNRVEIQHGGDHMKGYKRTIELECVKVGDARIHLTELEGLAPQHSVLCPFLKTIKSALIVLLTFLFVGVIGFTDGERAWGHDVDEEIKDEDVAFPDRIMARGGVQFLFGLDAKYRFDGPILGLGTTVSLDDVGGDDTDVALRVDALFRFNPRHSIGVSWYDIGINGSAITDDTLQIDDEEFQVGTAIQSKLDLSLYRIFYNYSFYHSKKSELYLSGGVYAGEIDFIIDGQAMLGGMGATRAVRINESHFYPLPSAGFGFNYLITPKLSGSIRGDVFYVNVADIEGSMAEFFVGLEYRLFKHFAVGASYDRMAIDVEYKKGKSGGFDIDASWNGAMAYGAVYW